MKMLLLIVALAAAGLFLIRWSLNAALGSACWGQGVGGGGVPFPSSADAPSPLTPSLGGGVFQA